jgi:hypothetical protein
MQILFVQRGVTEMLGFGFGVILVGGALSVCYAQLLKNSLECWLECAHAINSWGHWVFGVISTRHRARLTAAVRTDRAIPVEVIHGRFKVVHTVTVPKHLETLSLELAAECKHGVVARVVIQDLAGKHNSFRIAHVLRGVARKG